MAVTIDLPLEVYYYLKPRIWVPEPHSAPMYVTAFMRDKRITEAKLRARAQFERITLTSAFRAYLVEAYPDVAPLWPVPSRSQAQIDGIARRTKPPTVDPDLAKALGFIARLLDNPNDGQLKRRAKELLDKHGVAYIKKE
jgi:hypothetical protein